MINKYINFCRLIPVFCSLCLIGASAWGQSGSSWRSFLVGDWKGSGSFASGKKIEATLAFAPCLDNAWLRQSYQDVPPNRYAATALWSLDSTTGSITAHTFDNFGGYRPFKSVDVTDTRLILLYRKEGTIAFFQRFIYDKIAKDQMKLTYETSRDSVAWKLGDSLVFHRN